MKLRFLEAGDTDKPPHTNENTIIKQEGATRGKYVSSIYDIFAVSIRGWHITIVC